MLDTRHNGWTNYETWAVDLWIDNEESSQRYWVRETESHWEAASEGICSWLTRSSEARRNLAASLTNWHEEQVPELEGVFADLMNAALSEVNWDEIADSMLTSMVLDDTDDDGEKIEIERYEPLADKVGA